MKSGPQHEAFARSVMRYEHKAQLFTSLIDTVREEGRLQNVLPYLSQETKKLIATPPPITAWMPGGPGTELHCVLMDLFGETDCRRIAKRSIERGSAQTTRSITSGLLRLFGATPSTLFSRL